MPDALIRLIECHRLQRIESSSTDSTQPRVDSPVAIGDSSHPVMAVHRLGECWISRRYKRALTGTANGGRHKAMPLPWLRQCLSPCWATLPSSSLKGQLLFCQSVPPLPIGALRGTSGAVPARYAYPGLASSWKLPVQILGARIRRKSTTHWNQRSANQWLWLLSHWDKRD